MGRPFSSVFASLVLTALSLTSIPAPLLAGQQRSVTFTKDVAPIFQRSCQTCHRPGQIAPMSLLTYQDARPWARSIKLKVQGRQMPPWHIDKTIGIQRFKEDTSLTSGDIATIVAWVDGGAPMGDPADLPTPRKWEEGDIWHIGTPDLVVSSPASIVPAAGPDLFPNLVVPSGLTEDRYVSAVELRPSPDARAVVHHVEFYSLDELRDADLKPGDTEETSDDVFIAEYAQGKNADVFPEGSGKLMKAGSFLKFSLHNHSIGEQVTAKVQVGFVFYPKGYVPKRILYSEPMGGLNGTRTASEIEIPAGQIARHDGYTRLALPAKITAIQPHMHRRGKRQCVELIYPDDTQEVLNCVNFDFGWHIVYNYEDDVAPIAPAGTIVHVITWHDNTTALKNNPDPRNWIGWGTRTVDDMAFCWVSWYDMTVADYKQELEKRNARRSSQQK
jgi:hypothetical protein